MATPADVWIGRLLGLLLVCVYASFPPAPSWNQTSRMALVRALAHQHSPRIDAYRHETGDRAEHQGHAFSDKAPGASFLGLPAYLAFVAIRSANGLPPPRSDIVPAPAPGGEPSALFGSGYVRALHWCALLAAGLPGAWLIRTFFRFLRRWEIPRPRAVIFSLTLGLGTLLGPYSSLFYGHVLAATCLFCGFAALAEAGPDLPRWGLTAGIWAGAAVLVEYPSGIGCLALMMFAFHRTRNLRVCALFALGMTPGLLVLGLYNVWAFGTPMGIGYAHVTNPTFAVGMGQGAFGIGMPSPSALVQMLVGRSRGLLYLSPVLGFAFLGLFRGVAAPSHRRATAIMALGVVTAFLLMNAGYYMWWGGAAMGPRHVIPCLPFLALGFAFLPDGTRSRAAVFLVTCAYSIAVHLAASAVGPEAPPEIDILRDHILPGIFNL